MIIEDGIPVHPMNLRWLAEDLVRRRRADDRDRYAASQRQARLDPNPHQIDAVIFALRRLEEGGCILADEVGLGKTIEAGLVIAQGRAEGRERVLLIVPKPLLGQWQGELFALFALDARELTGPALGPGVHIIGREAAGSERGSAWIRAQPFDLCVIDEAHEMFAGLHKRYRSDGSYDDEAEHGLIAHRVREAIGAAPVLLLTATPIQNSLAELWGLAQYVEPTRTLFGDLPTFRKVFCDDDDRVLLPGQEYELSRRLSTICQRTLRRQAQEFLDSPVRRPSLPAVRVRDERRRARALRGRHRLPDAAAAPRLQRADAEAAPDRVSPSDGVVERGARGEPRSRRAEAARAARGVAGGRGGCGAAAGSRRR
ncbi:MAG: hypothetical protein EXR72_03725 [Myxococcales bacterium]|nr:hypothetical protein [Myxococcales bacterium]